MTEQVERVAKAICESSTLFDNRWDEVDKVTKAVFRKQARAAIAAMQPTPQEAAKVLLDTAMATHESGKPVGIFVPFFMERASLDTLRAISEDSHE